MKKPVQISIPTPCHENWQHMKPVEKGRFCDSCQKKVHDFTASPDKVILEAFAKDSRLCGRFRVDQLNRELIIPKEKSTVWTAASAAVVSFLALGNYTAKAQDTIPTEQHTRTNYRVGKFASPPQKSIVTGVVNDEAGPLPGAAVITTNVKFCTITDLDGNFVISGKIGDTLEVSFSGYETQRILIKNDSPMNVVLETPGPQNVHIDMYRKNSPDKIAGGGTLISIDSITDRSKAKRTFIGRIFQGIGNLFR